MSCTDVRFPTTGVGGSGRTGDPGAIRPSRGIGVPVDRRTPARPRITWSDAINELHAREREARPGAGALELTALRRMGDATAAELRRTLPITLAAIAGEIDGAELALGMFTGPDGMLRITLTAQAGADTSVLMEEIAAVLQPVAETTEFRNPQGEAAIEWPVVAASRHSLGFARDTEQSAAPMRFAPAGVADADLSRVVEALAGLVDEGLHVRVRTAARGAHPAWDVRIGVLTTKAQPSLRIRADVRRRFAGVVVAGSAGVDPVWWRVGPAELPHVFAVPVSGSEPLPGTYSGSAAPIAVSPARSPLSGGVGLRVGRAVTAGGRTAAVELSLAERLRHVHVVGQTGTGKSSALAGMVREIAITGDGALVADPHGHLCDRILAELPDEAIARTWVIRCGDVRNPVPMNPLAESDPVRRDIAIAEVCAVMQYLFDRNETGIVGPRFTERVSMTLRALAAVHGTRASLLDVPTAGGDDDFMRRAVRAAEDDRLTTWWRTSAMESRSSEHGQTMAWVNSKFETFSRTAATRAILGSGADAIDFTAVMDEGRIVLLDLSKAELGEAASRLLGFLYLNRIWQAALRRGRADRPFTIVVDEAHTLIAGALTNMLAEGRKFGLSVALAHQFLDQLDPDLRPAVDGNVATTIAFRCAVGDAATLHRRFGGLVDPSVLVTQPDLSAVCLRAAAIGIALPHTLMIDHNAGGSALAGCELDDRVTDLARATHTALVDPHREITTAALDGRSNVTTIGVDGSIRSRPAASTPDPARTRAAAPATGRSDAEPGLFDEWLNRRREAQRDVDDQPSQG